MVLKIVPWVFFLKYHSKYIPENLHLSPGSTPTLFTISLIEFMFFSSQVVIFSRVPFTSYLDAHGTLWHPWPML